MYSYFDTHCDTLLKLYKHGKTLFDKALHINYEALTVYKNTVQCFALFNEGDLKIQDYFDAADFLKKECDSSGRMSLCTDTYGIDKAFRQGKTAAVLTAEGIGNTPDFKPEHIFMLKKSGYMMTGLVWNGDNSLCGGALGGNAGITTIGAVTLRNMEKSDMIVDVSHMSERSCADVFGIFCKPVVASHSNLDSVCPNKRNLSDSNAAGIIKSGGAIGITVYPPFVGGKNSIEDLIAHTDRIISMGGAGNICIGADFDGIAEAVDGIRGGGDMIRLFEAFARHNYPKKLINDISFNNIYNIFKKYEI
ncbi:MAG: membrane dipeptidase [Clostridia bacterium]|nr:membrane dipeptidase [Clostridia bacterium]